MAQLLTLVSLVLLASRVTADCTTECPGSSCTTSGTTRTCSWYTTSTFFQFSPPASASNLAFTVSGGYGGSAGGGSSGGSPYTLAASYNGATLPTSFGIFVGASGRNVALGANVARGLGGTA